MKYTKIALACGLAFAAMSAQSASVPVPSGTTTIYVSGASAVDNFFADTVNTMMNNVTAIRAADDGDYRAYLGTSNGVTGVADGTNVLLIKRSTGGSVFGVNPVARTEKITTLDLDNCTDVSGTDPDYDWECGTKGDDNGAAAGLAPDFGLSDVEPNMFQGFNLKAGGTALSAAELSALVSQPVNQQGMGIVATDAVAATTHISRAQYGAMLAGRLASWSQVDGTDEPVIVCRRTNGSGTQASYNWFFSGFPCNTATNGFVANTPATTIGTSNITGGDGSAGNPLIVTPTTAKVTVVENSGSGGVRSCLDAAFSQTDFTTTETNGQSVTYKFSTLANPGKAIGVLSMDSYVKLVGKNAHYRYLDGAGIFDMATQTGSANATGIAPSKDNIVNGRYDFVLELSANQRAAGNDATKVAFWNELVKNLGSTTYTGDTTGTFTTVPNAFATLPTSASYDAEPTKVSKYTRGANTCQAMSWQPSL